MSRGYVRGRGHVVCKGMLGLWYLIAQQIIQWLYIQECKIIIVEWNLPYCYTY